MAVEAGVVAVEDTPRERFIRVFLELRREQFPEDRFLPALRASGEYIIDGVQAAVELVGDEPEWAAINHWVIAAHVNDPHDWDEIGTVVDLLRWRRDGTVRSN